MGVRGNMVARHRAALSPNRELSGFPVVQKTSKGTPPPAPGKLQQIVFDCENTSTLKLHLREQKIVHQTETEHQILPTAD